jgi:uncharacterized phage protein (TIGR02220 family)
MAKELPYFKFEPNQWENGNIQMLSRNEKGLFIDLCSMYWSRLGDVPLKLAIQKLCAGNATALNSLCDDKIIEVIEGNVFIKFLSEQLNEFEDTSKQNSKNAKEGWEKRRKQRYESERNAGALIPQCENDAIREDKIKEDNINNNLNPINWDALLNFFNTTTNKKCRVVSTKARNQFNARLKEKFTKEDIFKAIKNCYNDEWHIKNNHQYLTLEFISRADKLDKFSQIAIDTGKTNQKFMTYDN